LNWLDDIYWNSLVRFGILQTVHIKKLTDKTIDSKRTFILIKSFTLEASSPTLSNVLQLPYIAFQ